MRFYFYVNVKKGIDLLFQQLLCLSPGDVVAVPPNRK